MIAIEHSPNRGPTIQTLTSLVTARIHCHNSSCKHRLRSPVAWYKPLVVCDD